MKRKQSNNSRIFIGIVLLIAFLAVPFLTPLQNYLSIPTDMVTFNNESSLEVPDLGDNVQVDATDKSIQALDTDTPGFDIDGAGRTSQLVYEIAGFPIKKVNLSVLDDIKVTPGGQSIGVNLHTQGVLVVGHHQVDSGNENDVLSPGEDAEIEVGDIILKINGESIEDMESVKPIVTEAGENEEKLNITIKRGEEQIDTTLQPIMDKQNEYKIGLYIRDSAAGIGTMTFHEPESDKYGALGHVISDMDTKKPIEIHDGTIVRSSVSSIEKGNNGTPGEKQARFSVKENEIGTITKNSPFGIFGELNDTITNESHDEPMPVALSHEVKEGPAKILTVVEDEKVEEFEVEVVSSVPQKFPATKGMVIQITDEELLKETGGIVQGMSGSPIIQDDKIIGAVTHVFVNDPTSGYGVHIEWMLEEAGINIYKEEQEKTG
ncbi:stage IV sporulation protein B [Virgibacillus natechei]|uniref:Stage IV sporulation protein B n=1 Tax=Virgibacillus natechei TaxID=1216297 RepID=A0ABS4IFJ1_9BACI|nr:SpoIVB peptidase [Virgibacillus natechei]MBP1969700.1 stage IV sporulation protein B [Virgibacillus natechei]UZD11425.1 SpoIVB peptidase [Virgibacillus natechei]